MTDEKQHKPKNKNTTKPTKHKPTSSNNNHKTTTRQVGHSPSLQKVTLKQKRVRHPNAHQFFFSSTQYPHSHRHSIHKTKSVSRQIGPFFFLLEAAWVRSRAERPSVSEVSGQLCVQFGCKLNSKLTYETN